MDTLGYSVLIVALLVLAGVMLYGRFVLRSREKSLHHFPVERIVLSEQNDSESEEAIEVTEESKEAIQVVDLSQTAKSERGGHNKAECDYIDELQEAAAGLAVLMRSSPVKWNDPVIFEPKKESDTPESDNEEPEVAPSVVHHDEPLAEDVAEEEISTLSQESEVVDEEEASAELIIPDEEVDETVTTIEVAEKEPEVEVEIETTETVVEPEISDEPKTLHELLGESVAEQFNQIDHDLEDLSDLVAEIEASLSLLSSHELDEGEDTTDPDGDSDSLVAAAA